MNMILQSKDIINELTFVYSRSSGPGGQNVNKVNSRVTLKWDVVHSVIVHEEQKTLLIHKLSSRLTKDGMLMIMVQDHRSQLQNKEASLQRLDLILAQALTPKKARMATKPSKAAKRKRIQAKKLHSEKKTWRRKL